MRIEISKRGGWLTGWSISALVVIIAGLSLGSVDHTPSPIASSFFGMNLIKPKVWPNAPIGALGKGAGTSWRYLEPSRGVYKWYGTDEYVETAQRHGIDAL